MAINEELKDEEMTGVNGGFLVVSEWVNYLSSQVMPIINGLMNGASENDRNILNNIYGTLQGTAIRGAGNDVVGTVRQLWMTYNSSYRPSLQSSKIQVTLDQKLYSAKQYVESK